VKRASFPISQQEMLVALKRSESFQEKYVYSNKELGEPFFFLSFDVKRIEPEVLSVTHDATAIYDNRRTKKKPDDDNA
jgi:hypothetical protein